MNCKYCQGELASGSTLCPHCGKDNAQASMDKTKLALIIGAIVALALLGVGLIMITLFGIRGGWEQPTAGQTTPVVTTTAEQTTPAPTEYVPGEGILQRRTYTVDAQQAIAAGDTVVATVGKESLNNRQLQMYYWMQFYEVWSYYYNQYGGYTPYYIGLDYTQPFADQPVMDGQQNWEQYILELSLNSWHRSLALGLQAQKEGYTVTDEIRRELDALKTDLEATALQNGMDSVDALIQNEMGPGVTFQDYRGYMELYLLGEAYFADVYNAIQVTDDQMQAYYSENQEALELQGITKDSGNIGDVRHILIMPESATGEQTYTDEEWAACLAEAQKVLDEWKAGEATEESFIELTGKYTQDTGYASNGGLYTDVYHESGYVEAFENWIIDPARKPGDCELVKTENGYHVMYLVNSETAWVRVARESIRSEQCSDMVDEAVAQNPMEVAYDKIAIGSISFE